MLIRLLLQFAVMVVAVIVMVQIVDGIEVDSFSGYLQVSILMAIVNTFVKPIVKLITSPIILLTLGLALLVINAILLRIVIGIAPDASIDGFGSAIVGSIDPDACEHGRELRPRRRRRQGAPRRRPLEPRSTHTGRNEDDGDTTIGRDEGGARQGADRAQPLPRRHIRGRWHA